MQRNTVALFSVTVFVLALGLVGASCSRTETTVSSAEIGSSLPGVPGASEAASTGPAEKIYTACNLWFEQPTDMYTLNYKVGSMIPAGTEVRDIRIESGRRPRIFFRRADNGMEFRMQHRLKFHGGIPAAEYADRLFTKSTFKELTEDLSKQEIDAIKAGQPVVGMSKKAVIVCYGYPPEHRTPSLDSNRWIYWMNRFRTKAIHFDREGRTTQGEAPDPDAL